MELIDTHCHLTTFDEQELEAAFARAKECSIGRMLCIGASEGITTANQSIAIAEKYPHVFLSIGVHPHSAGEFTQLDSIEELITHPKTLAVGETGLDFFKDWAPRENQYELFRNSIAIAKKHKKPLIIHCRDAEEETFQVLKEEGASEVGGVFHCFVGNADFEKRAREINFMVSLTGVVTFKNAKALQEAVKEIPLEQIMLETDCPYMAPEPFRGKKSEPMHVYQIALKVAELKGLSLEEVAEITTKNAERLFGI